MTSSDPWKWNGEDQFSSAFVQGRAFDKSYKQNW